ncbi:Nuclear Hormone Receptor family [Caenorhabditis elegans]|uniref:Nuclear Hormone Receptor family n=1 Tax=Caenorhabditis elegans TaxID=6239 RepID=O16954_CAEEL|nr:Nuclear Hormone Receptor family [Caenorhabditis elegans]CCD64485.3 Nuclear Hormone Receptor family [Caenorhabditis elegans]|eukprot:NP_001350970.1 Nuclear Hormone Receptor family [Caenorhabditis elegans]
MPCCKVCTAEGCHGTHFGTICCRACAAFFRRTAFSKLRNSKCRSASCDKEKSFCKPCRLRKCLEVGMETSNFQYHRDSLHDSESSSVFKKLEAKHSKQTISKIPKSFECFVGRPGMILFWDAQKSKHRKTFIDVSYLLDEATMIFRQPSENVHIFENQLHRLAIGLKVVSGNTKNYRFLTKIDQRELSDTWQWQFLTVAKWLTHFKQFDALEEKVKLTLLQSTWHVWSVLDHHFASAAHHRSNPNALKTHAVTRRGVMMDMTNVHFDANWLSGYPSAELNRFLHVPSRFDITAALEALQPTEMERTFMLVQLSFEYAGKRCQGEMLQLTDYFQQVLATDLHDYYVKELRMEKYFDRLAKLMKVNNAIQKKLWEQRPRIELAKVFDLIKLEFSHPEMFMDTGFN